MTSKQAKPAPSRLATWRKASRNSCAMALALAIAGNGGVAGAQAINGTVELVSGSFARPGDLPTQTEISVLSDQLVLNWNLPSSSAGGSAPEEFLIAGRELTFADGRSSPTTTFTVLNRILPYEMVGMTSVPVNRPVSLNGTVSSAGEIWFFSPSGIIAGPTANFNVGSLVLTTNDIDTTGGLYGSGGEIRFRGPASSLAAVEIHADAVINAAAISGAYVAIVAPRIVQAGTVSANGHVALVAAEQADITINTGLVDIVVTQGTTDANGIVHTGSTGGGESSASDDFQILSLIAIPKNTALTMLLSGSIGYVPATGAFGDGSSVVLSAGYDANLSNAELAQNLGNIEIGNSVFTSRVTGVATNAINIAPNGGSVEFGQGGDLTGFRSVSAIAEAGESIFGNQALYLNSNQGVTGGTVTVRADGGSIGSTTNTMDLYASANGRYDSRFPEFDEGISGTGGTVTLEASNGGQIVARMIGLEAIGEGQFGMGTGGTGTGGTINASVSGGGEITANGFDVNATGIGGNGALNSGDGFGGTARLSVASGTFRADYVTIRADGLGGVSDPFDVSVPPQSGDGFGGTASMVSTGGTTTITGSLDLVARGFGGDRQLSGGGGNDMLVGTAPIAGNGTGGNAELQLAGGTVSTGDLSLDGSGVGGPGTDNYMGMTNVTDGGDGTGGSARVIMGDGSTASLIAGDVQLLANGIAGRGGTDGSTSATDGNGSAGQVQLTANAGSASGSISVTGDFNAEALGSVAPAGNGFVGNIGGAAFTVGGDSTIATARDVSLTVGAGSEFATTGTLVVSTPRTVSSSGLVSSGGDATIGANLGISMTDLSSGGMTYLMAQSGSVTVSNDLRSTGPVSVLGTSIDIASLGRLSFYDASATTGDISIRTAGDLVLPYVYGPGNVTLISSGGALLTEGPISGVNVSLSSAADLTYFNVVATGTLSLASTAGSVILPTALNATAITISAAGNIDTLDIISDGTVSLSSGGTLNVGGTIIGTDITATSGDLAISSAGSIGARGTTRTVTLRNANPNNRTFIGGAAQTNGYQVDATELTQLFADNSITLGAFDGPPGSGADLVIGNLALAYGANGNIGAGGTLKIMAPGRVEVSGAVSLTTSSDADRFSIDPTRIDIIADTGSIIMRGSAGNLQGELELVGGTIAVASSATLAQIANLTSQAQINEALDAAAAVPNPDGFLQAGSIVVDAANAFYIANTGATSDYADRRGFSANRLSITTGSASTHISINGVIVDSTGLAVTGKDVVPLVSINGQPATRPSLSSRFSTINGCFIGGSCEFSQQTELTRTKSDIEVPLDPEGSTKPEYLYVLEIEQPQPDDLQPLVDEPVTGVGNDDLWGSSCGPDSAGCSQGGNGQ